MKKYSAYTLAEVLISLTVVGILAAITVPLMAKTVPNKNEALMRKAYYVVDNIVQELINDKYYYPDATGNCYNTEADGSYRMNVLSGRNGCYYGFDNTVGVKVQGISDTIIVDRDLKFIALFISKLNTVEDFKDIYERLLNGFPVDVKTAEGIVYHFSSDWDGGDAYQIFIDVNGDKDPNRFEPLASAPNRCRNLENWDAEEDGACFKRWTRNDTDFDTIVLEITSDGKVSIKEGQPILSKILNTGSNLQN